MCSSSPLQPRNLLLNPPRLSLKHPLPPRQLPDPFLPCHPIKLQTLPRQLLAIPQRPLPASLTRFELLQRANKLRRRRVPERVALGLQTEQRGTRVEKLGAHAAYAKQAIRDKLVEHQEYIHEHGQDMPEVRNWEWSSADAPAGSEANP